MPDFVKAAQIELERMGTEPFIELKLDGLMALRIISVLQLALRHPHLIGSDHDRMATKLINDMTDQYPPDCVGIRKLIAAGFDRHFDA